MLKKATLIFLSIIIMLTPVLAAGRCDSIDNNDNNTPTNPRNEDEFIFVDYPSYHTIKAIYDYIDYAMEVSTPSKPVWNKELGERDNYWNYIDGCINTALMNLYDYTKNIKYKDFVDNFLKEFIVPDEYGYSIIGFNKEDYNLDSISQGRLLFDLDLYNPKIRASINILYDQLKDQPRIETDNLGSFWHKAKYKNQIWLDGLYMAQVFYTRYINIFTYPDSETKRRDYSDVMRQFENVENLMWNSEKQLYHHGYYGNYKLDRKVTWPSTENGVSESFWLRSIGWYLMALVDVIDYMPKSEIENIDKLSGYLKKAIDGILRYKDSETNMFYQVVDQGNREGNYLETSGSAMVSYTLLKAVRLGLLEKKYYKIGMDIFNGICNQYLTVEDGGQITLGGICLMAGLSGEDYVPQHEHDRDGSYEYYVSQPVVTNDAKGLGPFILAYTEIIRSMGITEEYFGHH